MRWKRFLSLCLFPVVLLCGACATIDQYSYDLPERKFTDVTTEIKKIVATEPTNIKPAIKEGQKLNIELVGVNITDVIKVIYGTVLNVPYIVDNDVYSNDQKIDIVIKQKTSHDEIKNIVKTALNMSGFDVIHQDGCFFVSRAKDSGRGDIEVNKDEKKSFTVRQLDFIKPETVKNRIQEILKEEFPDFKIYAEPGSDLIFYSINEKNHEKISKIISEIDLPERQVYIEIMVIETVKEGVLENGLAGYLSAVLSGVKLAYSPLSAGFDGINQFSIIKNPEKFNAILGILESNHFLYKVAQPHIVVKSGSEAVLSIGDKIPVLGSTVVSDGATTQDIIYKSTGFDLSIKPNVVGSHINIDLSIEISSGDINKLSTINSPTISSRVLKSSLICENSQAVMIGGIYQDKSLFHRKGLPVNNYYFENYLNYNNREKSNIELLFYIRPVIITNGNNTIKRE